MVRKALIVDDSKTARHTLGLLLRRIGFEVDMLASAEEALDYLQQDLPDLIFMDHLMPGMDGFQAVKAIKAEPRTTAIPIIMYTSREGEVYFGQAHALGAADILNKPVRAADLEAVLTRLEAAVENVPTEGGRGSERGMDRQEAADDQPAEALVESARFWTPVTEPLVPAWGAEVAKDTPPVTAWRDGAAPRQRWWRSTALTAVVAMLPVAWLLGLYHATETQRQQLLAERGQWYRTLEWGLNEAGAYPWGEPAMSGARLDRLQSLVSQLSALGFSGVLRLKVHIGDFCLIADGNGSWQLAPPALPVTECEALGLPAEDALALSEYQGGAFHHFIEYSPLLADDRIRVEWLGYGSVNPRQDYPLHVEQLSAAGWNAIAARNHRVEVELIPGQSRQQRNHALPGSDG